MATAKTLTKTRATAAAPVADQPMFAQPIYERGQRKMAKNNRLMVGGAIAIVAIAAIGAGVMMTRSNMNTQPLVASNAPAASAPAAAPAIAAPDTPTPVAATVKPAAPALRVSSAARRTPVASATRATSNASANVPDVSNQAAVSPPETISQAGPTLTVPAPAPPASADPSAAAVAPASTPAPTDNPASVAPPSGDSQQ